MLVSFSGKHQVQSAPFPLTDDTQACSLDEGRSRKERFSVYLQVGDNCL